MGVSLWPGFALASRVGCVVKAACRGVVLAARDGWMVISRAEFPVRADLVLRKVRRYLPRVLASEMKR